MPGQLRNSDTGIECPKYQSFLWLGRSKPGASLTRQIILEPGGSVEQVRDFRTLSISLVERQGRSKGTDLKCCSEHPAVFCTSSGENS